MSVIELFARYRVADDELSALLHLEGDPGLDAENDPNGEHAAFILTIIHECFAGEVVSYDFLDQFALNLEVRGGETLTVIGRRAGRVVGSLVNEIDTQSRSRVLLRPRGGYNVIVYQEREPEADRAPTTGGLALASIQP